MIAIIDYGSGNIAAIMNVFRQRKIAHALVSDPRELAAAERFLLPGVGAFDPTMENLMRTGMVDALNEEVLGKGKKALGICVGMHLLAEGSEEGDLPGLGWIKGWVRRIPTERLAKPSLPHMGWNSVVLAGPATLFGEIDTAHGFYFLHSYFFDAADPNTVVARVDYGAALPCAVERANVFGVQFHPEKSHSNGGQLFANFAGLA